MTTSFNPDNRDRVAESLVELGYAELGPLLADDETAELEALYPQDEPFRSRIVMQQHGFGEGEYKYFDYPLPGTVSALRRDLYAYLAPIANEWAAQLDGEPFPDSHDDMLARCHADGQTRPTPLMLRYVAGGYNCLHQDLYGEHVFPLQVVILLTDPHAFDGGEFVLTEQRPHRQSRVNVVPLVKGHGVVFTVNERPRKGQRGYYRVKTRHGVSPLRSGERCTLGIIFHDAA